MFVSPFVLLTQQNTGLYHGMTPGAGYSHIFAEGVCTAENSPFLRPDPFQKTPVFENNQIEKTPISTEMSLRYCPIRRDRPHFTKSSRFVTLSGFEPAFCPSDPVKYNFAKFPPDASLSIGKL